MDKLKRLSAVIATTNKASDNVMFSDEALECLVKTAVGRPVLVNFDIDKAVGVVDYAEHEDGHVTVEIELGKSVESIEILEKLRIVPGFIIEKDSIDNDGIRTIEKVRFMSCSFTVNPAEKDLPEIVEL